MKRLVALACLLLGAQDPAALIEQLGSEDIAVRERALAELEKLGEAAEAALKKAAEHRDANIAEGARRLLKILDQGRAFSPALKKAVPGIARRLASGDEGEWSKAYLEFWTGERNPIRRHPEVTREDLETLALNALRHAGDEEYDTTWGRRHVKQDVLEAIGTWRHRSAEPEVVKLLSSDERYVALVAAETLTSLLGKSAIPHLLKAFQSEPEKLLLALGDLDAWDQEEAEPKLLEMMIQHPVNASIALHLARLGDSRLGSQVFELLKHPKASVRRAAITMLAQDGHRKMAERLNPLLTDGDPAIRRTAVKALIQLRVRPDFATLKRLAEDDDGDVRAGAANLAGWTGPPEIVDLLVKLSTDSVETTRLEAVRALGLRPSGRSGQVLAACLRDKSKAVREAAVDSLGRIGASEHADAIAAQFDDENLRQDAGRAFTRLSWTPGVDRLIALLDNEESEVVELALTLLAAADPARARPELVRIALHNEFAGTTAVDLMARQPDPGPLLLNAVEGRKYASERAVQSLARLKIPGAAAALRNRLKETEGDARAALVKSLARLEPVEARADFKFLLDDGSESVRAEAALALGRTPPGAEVRRLRELTGDPSARVRQSAVETLGRWKSNEALPELRKLREDAEFGVAAAAMMASFEAGDPGVGAAAVEWLLRGPVVRTEDPWDEGQLTASDVGERILSLLGPGEWRAKVAKFIKHRDSDVRRRAARLIGRWGMRGEASAVLPLIFEKETSDAAVAALEALGDPAVVAQLWAKADQVGGRDRALALSALLTLDPNPDSARLRSLARDKDLGVAIIAIAALGKAKDQESAPIFIECLESRWSAVRKTGVAALSKLKGPEIVKSLLKCTEDPDTDVREEALSGLLMSAAPEATPVLLEELKLGPRWTVERIMWTLAERGVRDAIPAIKIHLDNPEVRETAAVSLAKLQARDEWEKFRRRKDLTYSERGEIAKFAALEGDAGAALEFMKGILEPDTRVNFARNLVLEGNRAGASAMIDELEIDDLLVARDLNAIRNPAGWKKLEDTACPVGGRLTARARIERIGAAAGLPVRWSEGSTFEERDWMMAWVRHDYAEYECQWALTDLFTPGVDRPPGYCLGSLAFECPWEFIVEKDHIRVLPRREAIAFWKQWWADEQAKKK